MDNEIGQIRELRELTGCSLSICKKALEYKSKHKGCTAIGYCKAKELSVKTTYSFENRVKAFSSPEDKI